MFGERADLVHVLVAEQPVFPCEDDGADDPLMHVLKQTVEFIPLVNAFLTGHTRAFVIQTYVRFFIAVEQPAVALQPKLCFPALCLRRVRAGF